MGFIYSWNCKKIKNIEKEPCIHLGRLNNIDYLNILSKFEEASTACIISTSGIDII